MPHTLAVLFALVAGLLAGCGRTAPAVPENSGGTPAVPGDAKPEAAPPVGPAESPKAVGSSGGLRYYNRVVALCIGIENYGGPRPGPAPDCEKGAGSMAALFRTGYGYEVVELLGQKATKANILAELARLTNELGDRDVLIVYFAGHGKVIDLPSYDRAGYLLPYDANLHLTNDRNQDDWERKALNMAGLTEGTLKAKAQHVLFLVNACCSGFMAHLGGNGLSNRPDNVMRMSTRSRMVLAATDADRPATTGSGSRYGHFTACLQKQLGGSTAVCLSDLYSIVSEEVTRNSNGVMFPQIGRFGADGGEFVFIPRALDNREVESAKAQLEAEWRERSAQWTKPEHLYDLLEKANYKTSPKRADLERVWEKRVNRFRANTALGDSLGLTALALCSLRGLGMDKADPVAADVYARRAQELKRPEGKFARAMTLLEGPDRNELAARELLAQAVNEGCLLANVALADLILVGKPSERDAAHAEDMLAKAEAGGITVAGVRRVATAFRAAKPSAEDAQKMIERVRPAADAGCVSAQYLTYQLITSRGKPLGEKESAEALKRLTQAAEAGIVEAQFQLASEHYQMKWFPHHLTIPKDSAAARLWAEAAERQGHMTAKTILATVYLLGDGAEQNIHTAGSYSRQVPPLDPQTRDWAEWYMHEFTERMRKK